MCKKNDHVVYIKWRWRDIGPQGMQCNGSVHGPLCMARATSTCREVSLRCQSALVALGRARFPQACSFWRVGLGERQARRLLRSLPYWTEASWPPRHLISHQWTASSLVHDLRLVARPSYLEVHFDSCLAQRLLTTGGQSATAAVLTLVLSAGGLLLSVV